MVLEVSLVADQAGLLCMLEVIAVTFAYLSIDSLLDPDNLINQPKVMHYG